MVASVEKVTTNSTKKYSFLDYIGEPVPKSKLIGKRVCDIVFGTVFGAVSLPVILIFGILVKLTSKGPVFFKQQRVGYMGKPITIVKLPSMKNDAAWAPKMVHVSPLLDVL